jgi:hypothetical protein
MIFANVSDELFAKTEVKGAGLDVYGGLQEVEVPKILKQPAHGGDNAVSPTHRSPLSPRENHRYSFLLEAESIPRATVRPEGISQ